MSIIIDKIDDGLPISVIVPLSKGRESFFYSFVLPLIEANEPKEIIINSNHGSAPKKRNDGFKKSSQPYVFFCDDDILLPANMLDEFYKRLKTSDKNTGYVYCSYDGIVLDVKNHPMNGNFKIKSKPFDGEALKKMNYISTMSLIKREYFFGFDEKLPRFQDWSLYLYMLEKGIVGEFVENIKFLAFYLDEGITSKNRNINNAHELIRKKHKL